MGAGILSAGSWNKDTCKPISDILRFGLSVQILAPLLLDKIACIFQVASVLNRKDKGLTQWGIFSSK